VCPRRETKNEHYYWLKTLKVRDHSGDTDTAERVILVLKLILNSVCLNKFPTWEQSVTSTLCEFTKFEKVLVLLHTHITGKGFKMYQQGHLLTSNYIV
jgi:hypothetical protein